MIGSSSNETGEATRGEMYVISKGSMNGRRGKKLHVRAQVVKPSLANLALIASDAGLKSNAVPNGDVLHCLPHLLHNSGTFVADDHRLLHYKVTTSQVLHNRTTYFSAANAKHYSKESL